MAYNGTTVPTGRDNTYNATEVHRKSSEEVYNTAFNDEQKSVIEDMASNISGLSSSIEEIEGVIDDGFLPEVTSDDNGKVLTVVEGVWDKAAGGGSTEALVVEIDAVSPTEEEVVGGFFNGVPVLYKETGDGWVSYTLLSGVTYYGNEYLILFDGTQLYYSAEDGWHFNE